MGKMNLAVVQEMLETDTPRTLDEKEISTGIIESGQISKLTRAELVQRAGILKKIADLTKAA